MSIEATIAEIQALLNSGNIESAQDVLRTFGEDSYREGYKDSAKNHAIWHHGEQLVGGIRNLKAVLDEVDTLPVPIVY